MSGRWESSFIVTIIIGTRLLCRLWSSIKAQPSTSSTQLVEQRRRWSRSWCWLPIASSSAGKWKFLHFFNREKETLNWCWWYGGAARLTYSSSKSFTSFTNVGDEWSLRLCQIKMGESVAANTQKARIECRPEVGIEARLEDQLKSATRSSIKDNHWCSEINRKPYLIKNSSTRWWGLSLWYYNGRRPLSTAAGHNLRRQRWACHNSISHWQRSIGCGAKSTEMSCKSIDTDQMMVLSCGTPSRQVWLTLLEFFLLPLLLLFIALAKRRQPAALARNADELLMIVNVCIRGWR